MASPWSRRSDVAKHILTLLLSLLPWLASASARLLMENVAYLELSRGRLVVYHGLARECSILGDRGAVDSVLHRVYGGGGGNGTVVFPLPPSLSHLTLDKVEFVDSSEMRAILNECQSVHAGLYQTEAESFLDVDGLGEEEENEEEEEENGVGWGDRSDNSLAIYKGLEKKRRKERQRNNSIWGWNLFNRILIMPGTKWCGQGDIADHYDDLGYHRNVDKCCRYVTVHYEEIVIVVDNCIAVAKCCYR